MIRQIALLLLWFLTASSAALAEPVETLETDVCVVGGGSGGIAAALGAARSGAKCILVEKMNLLGGTSTSAYVCHWGPGPGDEFAQEIYDRLSKLPDAVGITRDHNSDRRDGSFGLWLTTPGLSYEDSLMSHNRPREDQRGVSFEPEAFHRVVLDMLEETGNCRVMRNTTFTTVESSGKRLHAILVKPARGRPMRIEAKVFIDATGGVQLCRAAGFETMLGPDPKSRFGEQFAPEEPGNVLNAISLCYRITPREKPERGVAPDPPVDKWPRSAHCNGLPCGDIIVNPLATVPGRDLIDLGYDECMVRAQRIVQAQWRWLQEIPPFAGYEFHSFAPALGVRESYRVVTEYVLCQQDLEAGLAGQSHPDVIAVADHSMDVHGAGSKRVSGHLSGPYGVPYRCLIPKGSENLLVACRGAGFSQIAASSCRLSRTIIQLGHAAGLAAAMSIEENVPVGNIDTAALRQILKPEQRCR
jgi:hypothetical protein